MGITSLRYVPLRSKSVGKLHPSLQSLYSETHCGYTDSWAEPGPSVCLGKRKVLLAWEDGKDQMFPCSENLLCSAPPPRLRCLSEKPKARRKHLLVRSVAATLGSPGLHPEYVSSGPSRDAVPVVCPVELPQRPLRLHCRGDPSSSFTPLIWKLVSLNSLPRTRHRRGYSW